MDTTCPAMPSQYTPIGNIHLNRQGMSETLAPVKFEGKDIVFDVVNAGHLKVKRLDAFAARHAQRMPWLYMAFLIVFHGQVELLGGTLATTPPTSLKEFPTNKLTSQELGTPVRNG